MVMVFGIIVGLAVVVVGACGVVVDGGDWAIGSGRGAVWNSIASIVPTAVLQTHHFCAVFSSGENKYVM